MTVPEHYARRTRLAVGTEVTVSLLPDGIHLMPLTGGDPSKSEKP
jgi:hypothetical protein